MPAVLQRECQRVYKCGQPRQPPDHLVAKAARLLGCMLGMVHKASVVPSKSSLQGQLLGKARLGWWVGPGQLIRIRAVG